MGIVAAGGNYKGFHKRVSELKIDTSHFTGAGWCKNQTFGPKRPIEDYLSNRQSISSNSLKKRLLSENVKDHICEECKLDWWLFDKIPLELHHVNGNSSDNSLSNLQLLCPNCHALTDNYRGRNQARAMEKEARIEPNPPIIKSKQDVLKENEFEKEQRKAIHKEKLKNRKVYPHPTKINWPSDEDLVDAIWENSVTQFARENGLCGNTIKKRCKRKNLPVPPIGFFRKKETGNDISNLLIPYLEYKKVVRTTRIELV